MYLCHTSDAKLVSSLLYFICEEKETRKKFKEFSVQLSKRSSYNTQNLLYAKNIDTLFVFLEIQILLF
jgi:hypothetical protein